MPDLDVIVVSRECDTGRLVLDAGGWRVEAHVLSERGLRDTWEQELRARWCPISRMCAEGVVLAEHKQVGVKIRAEARGLLACAPSSVDSDELEWRIERLESLARDLDNAPDN